MSSSDAALTGKSSDFVIKTPQCVHNICRSAKAKREGRPISRTLWLCLQLLSRIEIGTIHLIAPDGRKYTFKGAQPGITEGREAESTVIIYNERAIRRFLTRGNLGFCEAYLTKDWSSPDITAFFEVILRNGDKMQATLHGKPWVRFLTRLLHKTRPNSLKGSRKNIYAHYDIGNDFYAAWLDPSLTYSSALFEGAPDISLEEAQKRKYEAMARALEISPSMHVLEIGCGWGGFAEHLGRNHDCRVTAITISVQQYEYARERIEKAGLSDKVEILFRDYRKIDQQFDRIASIEMFEAVGEEYWNIYFQTLNNCLKPSGRAVIQTITISDKIFEPYRKKADFIQKYIFPGGMLPCPSVLNKHIEKAGLSAQAPLSFGEDYARTLNIWNRSFQNVWPEIEDKGFDRHFKRLWEIYLCYCEAGFRVGTTDVIQLPVVKNG